MRLRFQPYSPRIMVLAAIALTLTSYGSLAQAPAPSYGAQQSPTSTSQEHRIVQPSDLQWRPGPPALPPGAQAALLSGDPAKPGPFVIRFKAPAGYKIPPHWHPATEQLTVISGSINFGMGDTPDQSKSQALETGSFVSMPAGMHHFAWTSEPTIIQVNGIGPWEIHYINPADDPRQRLAPTGRTQE